MSLFGEKEMVMLGEKRIGLCSEQIQSGLLKAQWFCSIVKYCQIPAGALSCCVNFGIDKSVFWRDKPMVLIHRESFDIVKNCSLEEERDKYFECDEAIAPAISLLNRKGYRTTFCCSGHLYDDITDTLLIDEEEMPEEALYEAYPGIIKIGHTEDGFYRLTLRQNLSMQAYVTFAEDVELPSVPEGWRERGHTILHNFYWDESFEHPYAEKDLQEKDPYLFYRRRLEIMEALYDWAVSLPPRIQ